MDQAKNVELLLAFFTVLYFFISMTRINHTIPLIRNRDFSFGKHHREIRQIVCVRIVSFEHTHTHTHITSISRETQTLSIRYEIDC